MRETNRLTNRLKSARGDSREGERLKREKECVRNWILTSCQPDTERERDRPET